ncbi:VOC family protein [Glycomyces xiaoerkulensis]|uniref:VOC family protein n=1 Tax=Glycomyces xiaoerkulensis TaxID=2038139 RepID=UPI000C26016D|nr:VOC family protein [Glycomyces xiaoerkulensis]
MPTSIPLGAPIWADANAPDLAAELEFYTRLFDWKTFDAGEEFGHYTELCLGTSVANARAVAGIAPNQTDQPDRPASWGVAFHVEDCLLAAAHAEKLGATTITQPMRVGDDLVYAALKDPDGGGFGLYEPLNDGMGFTAYGEPGATAWFEYVYDGDPAEPMQFYAELLDWALGVRPAGGPDAPVALRTRETGLEFGGCHAADGPERDLDPQWVVCFGADSLDRKTARAVGLGGRVVVPPGEERARTAVLSSPSGALFGLTDRFAG